MKTKKFKNLLKESLKDALVIAQSQCQEVPGISVCDLLGSDKSQKLIAAGEIIRDIAAGQQYSPDDAEYMINLISVAKREFGEEDEDVINFETAVSNLMNISGDVRPTMESLRDDFSKFKLH